MSGETRPSVQFDQKGEPELPFQWQQVQTAIWLLGMAIIAWRGWWFPGIIVLLAISGLTQALIVGYLRRGDEQREVEATRLRQETERKAAEEARATALPEQCPGCGAPLTATTVIWRSGTTASCPFCNTSIKATRPAAVPK